MSIDQTQSQPSEELVRARELSLASWRPPTELAGYEPLRCLGTGAFGEVWVALDRSTNRKVAIKFFTPQAGRDWSLLAREVEKLAYLSADRYVVQLLDVGWDATPPYYVMEYLDDGSLEDLLKKQMRLPVAQAVEIARELAVGLGHAHDKGVLHCDLKPGNVLLDSDLRPRLADFGQARLSHERQSSLGTLFYMSPEQADPQAQPDARWDVYALGVMIYRMLTGELPFRDAAFVRALEGTHDLDERLNLYRRKLSRMPTPKGHREISGVDSDLAEIVDRCLSQKPDERYTNVAEVLAAFAGRARRRALRPLLALGAIGPAVLLLIVASAAWWWFARSLEQSRAALTEQALESLSYASRNVAVVAGNALERRFDLVERIAADEELATLTVDYSRNDDLTELRGKLSQPNAVEMQLQPLREKFKRFDELEKIQTRLTKLLNDHNSFEFASWFVADARGLQIARSPESGTIGQNYAWRTYFHGETTDHDRDWRPTGDQRIRRTHLSAVYRSQTTKLWSVAISSPIFKRDGSEEFLGIVAFTFEVGKNLIEFQEGHEQFPVLIDAQSGGTPGLIVQHPLFDRAEFRKSTDFERLDQLLVDAAIRNDLDGGGTDDYRDPVGEISAAGEYRQRWLAGWQPVLVRGRPTGWIVLVQQSYETVLGRTLTELRAGFIRVSVVAVVITALVSGGLWFYCLRMSEQTVRPSPV